MEAGVKMTKAEEVVFHIVHGGRVDDFLSRLPNRPDWQEYVRIVERAF